MALRNCVKNENKLKESSRVGRRVEIENEERLKEAIQYGSLSKNTLDTAATNKIFKPKAFILNFRPVPKIKDICFFYSSNLWRAIRDNSIAIINLF